MELKQFHVYGTRSADQETVIIFIIFNGNQTLIFLRITGFLNFVHRPEF
jgi:hypothetical protein